MNLATRKHFRGRRYPVNLIKLSCIYDPAEIAKLFGIHRNTVRHWLKEGLAPIDPPFGLCFVKLLQAPASPISHRIPSDIPLAT
jgi:hypothetical protein